MARDFHHFYDPSPVSVGKEVMVSKDLVPQQWVEVTRPEKRVTVTESGVQIQRRGKPLSSEQGYVYLAVDCSGSMEGEKLNQAKSGALSFAKDALQRGYLTGLIKFHTVAALLCEPQREISTLADAIGKIKIGGSTNMADAIRLGREKLKYSTGNRALVVVTDGAPDNAEDTLNEAQETKRIGIDIIAIGTDHADQEFLKKLASRTELGFKVSSQDLATGIASAAQILPQLGSGRPKNR